MMMVFFLILTVCMALAMHSDLTRYLIPNYLVLLVLLLYPAMVVSAPVPVDWPHALMVMGVVFALGLGVFSMGWMGGGDIKLMIACSLWTGVQATPDFLMLTAISGGLLSLALILGRPWAAWLASRRSEAKDLPRVLTIGEPLPYGLAIAAAFLATLWTGGIQGLPLR